MKGTIIVLNKGEGYVEEDTYEVVVSNVYHTDNELFDVWMAYSTYQAKFYTEKGVDMFCNESGAVEFKYPNKSTSNERAKIQRKYWKINKEFKKELSMRYYIEEVLKAKRVNFTCGFDFEK
jgi:hypothetical protein